jgi:elongation factor Ts
VSRDEVPSEVVDSENEIYLAQARGSGKPEQVWPKIVEGKLNKWYEQVVLLEQPFVKDPDKTIDGYRREMIAKIGENIEIRRFVRFQLGEELA